MNFRVDLPVQEVGRETGEKIDLGLDAGGRTEGREKGMGHYRQHCWLVSVVSGVQDEKLSPVLLPAWSNC